MSCHSLRENLCRESRKLVIGQISPAYPGTVASVCNGAGISLVSNVVVMAAKGNHTQTTACTASRVVINPSLPPSLPPTLPPSHPPSLPPSLHPSHPPQALSPNNVLEGRRNSVSTCPPAFATIGPSFLVTPPSIAFTSPGSSSTLPTRGRKYSEITVSVYVCMYECVCV